MPELQLVSDQKLQETGNEFTFPTAEASIYRNKRGDEEQICSTFEKKSNF